MTPDLKPKLNEKVCLSERQSRFVFQNGKLVLGGNGKKVKCVLLNYVVSHFVV